MQNTVENFKVKLKHQDKQGKGLNKTSKVKKMKD